MTSEERAYIAGLIDGEGCIGARIDKHGFVQASVEVVGTVRRPLDYSARVSGLGNVYSRSGKRDRRDIHTWVLSAQPAAQMLRECMPYFQVKGAQARAFSILAHLRTLKVGGRRQHPIAEEMCARIITRLKDGDS